MAYGVIQHKPPQKMVIIGLWFRANSERYELRPHLDYFPAMYLGQVICSQLQFSHLLINGIYMVVEMSK